MVEKCFEMDSIFGVSLEKVLHEVGELRAGADRDPRGQPGVLLVKLLQCLRGLGLQQGSQTYK